MKYIQNKLGRQLLLILVIIFDIVLINIIFLVPNMLNPIYESIIYNSLKSPIDLVDSNLSGNDISRDIAFLYVADADGRQVPIITDGCWGLEMGQVNVRRRFSAAR